VIPTAIINVTRQRRRTAAGAVAVTFGVVAFLLAGGFIEWVYWAMREGTIKANIGHVQIVRPGYFKSGQSDPFRYLLPQEAPELSAIEQVPHVLLASPRISFSGLISLGDSTVSYVADGVDPERAAELVAAALRESGEGWLDGATATAVLDCFGVAPVPSALADDADGAAAAAEELGWPVVLKATGLTKVGDGGGTAHEDIVVHRVPLDRVAATIAQHRAKGHAIDAKLIALLGGNLLEDAAQ